MGMMARGPFYCCEFSHFRLVYDSCEAILASLCSQLTWIPLTRKILCYTSHGIVDWYMSHLVSYSLLFLVWV